MKATNRKLAVSVLALAVQGALLAMASTAQAQDATVEELTAPENYVEIGIGATSDKSAKFGEYNGLNKDGAHLIGGFGVHGGDLSPSGTTRWSVTGSDLGTDSRELGAALSNQGKWFVGFDYDSLRHNFTDSYNTPYIGSAGSNNFTLPAGFGIVPTTGVTAPQQAMFHQEDVFSKRENTSFNAGVNFNEQLGLVFDYKHIEQSGAKLISAATDKDVFNGISTWKGEGVSMMLNPTQSKTDNFNLALNWSGDRGYATVGYYGSIYRDDNAGFSWSNAFTNVAGVPAPTIPGVYPTDTMSTPPSNQFHQINLTGGFSITPSTRLAGGLSYARGKQDEGYGGTYTNTSNVGGVAFSTYTAGPASLTNTVNLKHIDLKLTSHATKDLNLSAGYKYNERDNTTSSNQYTFYILGDAANSGTTTTVTNIPMSWKHTQYDLGADYRINSNQHVRLGYEYDVMKRWCNNDSSNVAAGYYTQTSCVMVPENKENKLSLDYKLHVNEALNLKAGYSYGDRKADVNDIANAAFKNVAFYSPNVDNNAYEFTGFVAFFQASRKEDMLKFGADWQPSDKLSIGLGAKVANDDYGSTYGVQKGSMYNINLDANYAYSKHNSVNAYLTTQHRERDLTNAYSAAAGTIVNGVATLATQLVPWNNKLSEDDLTIGIGAKQNSLMGGKLELAEDLTYSLAKTDYSTDFGWSNGARNCTGSVASTTYCGAFPTIKSEVISLKLTGSYHLDKVSRVVMGYQYQHLKSDDPTYYQYYQSGYKTSVMPTNQQAPNYDQNVVFAAYNYSFK